MIYHWRGGRTSCSGYKLGEAGQELLIMARGWVGHRSAGDKQMCWALVSLGFYSSLLLFIIICSSSSNISIINIILYFASVTKVFLYQPTSFTSFSLQLYSPFHQEWEWKRKGKGSEGKNREGRCKEWARGCVLTSCKLKLSHGRFNAGKDGNYETKGKTVLAELWVTKRNFVILH